MATAKRHNKTVSRPSQKKGGGSVAGKRRSASLKRGSSKKSRKKSGCSLTGCFWACLIALLVGAALVGVLYFAFPSIYHSIVNRVVGSYRPQKGEKYDGIDVSHNNGIIDWDQVATDPNIRFVYIKASEGYKYADKAYEYNLKNARKAGIKAGSYHVLTTKTSMATQFNYFKNIADRDKQDIVPMVDLEESKLKRWTKTQMQDSLAKFLTMMEDYYSATPVVYCSYKFYKNNLSKRFDNYILFIARYSKNEPELDNKQHDIWQFTEHGTVKGIEGDVDLDRFGHNTSLPDILY